MKPVVIEDKQFDSRDDKTLMVHFENFRVPQLKTKDETYSCGASFHQSEAFDWDFDRIKIFLKLRKNISLVLETNQFWLAFYAFGEISDLSFSDAKIKAKDFSITSCSVCAKFLIETSIKEIMSVLTEENEFDYRCNSKSKTVLKFFRTVWILTQKTE